MKRFNSNPSFARQDRIVTPPVMTRRQIRGERGRIGAVPFRRGSRNAKVDLLRGVSLFSACSNRELTRIASLADEIEVPEGRVLIRQGEPGREFFVIVEGKAKVSARGKRAQTLGPGAGLGEL